MDGETLYAVVEVEVSSEWQDMLVWCRSRQATFDMKRSSPTCCRCRIAVRVLRTQRERNRQEGEDEGEDLVHVIKNF